MNIRQAYIDFFAKKDHKVYDSMPLIPDDASLLFTNAGMVQFKDIFTGNIPIPTLPRATSSQLCIRAGGKHNDLENVGYTARHHTLFEMLGNFSFGDYFKKEAIAYAWEFVTQILGFDKSVLYVTIHESDDEAYKLWCEHIAAERIKRMGDKDNFWQMGDSGPCGPCSEIYVDQGDKYFHSDEDYFGGEGDRFLEIWNLVFMQFEQKDGKRIPLPKPSIDTGMGLERVIALKEGKINNFDTSLFAPLMRCIENLTHKTYMGDDEIFDRFDFQESQILEIKNTQASFRVIADHARSVAFLLAQGVNFDKEGRGYVLRRILRRAVRHGYLLGLKKPFLYEVVGVVCESMGEHYCYLQERKNAIKEQCNAEELRFFETIESGMALFNAELESLQSEDCKKQEGTFSGEVAFKLYDTYGFPLDLTQDMLRQKHIQVDMEVFDQCMNEQKNRSKASWKGSGDSLKEGDFNLLLSKFGKNEFVGYESNKQSCKIKALLDSNFRIVDILEPNSQGWVMLDITPFYPESGGPVGDTGVLYSTNKALESSQAQKYANVLDTQKFFGLNLSLVESLRTLKVEQEVFAEVDSNRLEIMKHHSATHLLHFALSKVLGSHIAQAGSLVQPHRLRFDFSHPKALTNDEITHIENLVNEQILKANSQKCETMNIKDAKEKGAKALFGEKYGESVRVISFGDSIELCGGIHIKNTAEIGSFYITKESSVSSGVRRIEAVCGNAAYQYGKNALIELDKARESLKSQDVLQGIDKLKMQLNEAKERVNKAKQNIKSLDYEEINGVKLIVLKLDFISANEAKELIDRVKNENENVAILLLTKSKNKISIAAGVKNAQLKAGTWVKQVAQILGGSGGGRDDFATAGGRDISKINEALALAIDIAKNVLRDY
ncbi:alanine--tRNA ligase [Helicobacter muridarum]|uniref:Alanine--tRNA ligase n=1 Tax=Helicobacter muridarum TaxID=216 RepID=A0A099TXU9_9HELI|nr:alanine--tRNA ligase [Helicobacter muridarum]TLD99421.1 alanine--tRNA ligase [Helicobacter muridarum]STQ85502.1 alanyl-tRNA synthetase [Helicobacter muridarum]